MTIIISSEDAEDISQFHDLYVHQFNTNFEYRDGDRAIRLNILEEIFKNDGIKIVRYYNDYGTISDFSYVFDDEADYTFFLLKWS